MCICVLCLCISLIGGVGLCFLVFLGMIRFVALELLKNANVAAGMVLPGKWLCLSVWVVGWLVEWIVHVI